jgi:hypothetical protein
MEPSKAVKEYKEELVKSQKQNERLTALVDKVVVEKELLTLHEYMCSPPWSNWAGRNSGVNTCAHEGLAVPSLQVAAWSTWAGRNSGVNTCAHEWLAVPSPQVAPSSTWAGRNSGVNTCGAHVFTPEFLPAQFDQGAICGEGTANPSWAHVFTPVFLPAQVDQGATCREGTANPSWAHGRNLGVNTCAHERLAVPSVQVEPWSTWAGRNSAMLTKVPPVQKELLTVHEHMCSLPSSYLPKLTKVPPVEKELLTLQFLLYRWYLCQLAQVRTREWTHVLMKA